MNNELVENDALFFKEVLDSILTEGKEKGIFGFYQAFRKLVDRLEPSVNVPLLFGDAYIGWKRGTGNTIPQSVIVHDLTKISQQVKDKQIPTIVLLFDECDLLAQNETLLQKIRNVFQDVDGYVMVLSGTDKMLSAVSEVFSPIPRFFKHINVENFKSIEETKECILKPLTEDERKCVDERSIAEIHSLTGGSPYEVNLVSHYMYKSWNKQPEQKMSLSVGVLEDVVQELERLRKTGHHVIADQIKQLYPDYLRVLISLIEFPNVTKEQLVGYNLLSHVTSKHPNEIASERSVLDALITTLTEESIVAADRGVLSFKGDVFDILFLKYTAATRGISDFFVGIPGTAMTNLWRRFEKVFLGEFDQYDTHLKFDPREFGEGTGKKTRTGLFGTKVAIPPGPPGERTIMTFTPDEMDKRFYLGTDNSIRFRVNVDFMDDGFVSQIIFKKTEHVEQLRSKLVSLVDRLEAVGVRVLLRDEIYWNNEGAKFIHEGKVDDALRCLEKALAINPWFELAWLNKSRVALQKKEFDNVVNFAEKALAASPRWAPGLELRGVGYINLGNNAEALKDLEKACELSPETWSLWDNKGRGLFNLGRHREAADCFQKSLSINSDNGEVMYLLGASLSRVGEFPESLAWLDRSISKVPENASALLEKSTVLMKMSRNEDALRVLEEVEKLNPGNIQTQVVRSLVYDSLSRYQDAIACCDKILELSPNNPDGLYNKACYQSKAGLLDDALTTLKKALQVEPGLVKLIEKEEDLQTLKKDPRFAELFMIVAK